MVGLSCGSVVIPDEQVFEDFEVLLSLHLHLDAFGADLAFVLRMD